MTLTLTPVPRLTLHRWQITRKVAIELELGRLRVQHAQLQADVLRQAARRAVELAELLALTTRPGRCQRCAMRTGVTIGADGRWRCGRCRVGRGR